MKITVFSAKGGVGKTPISYNIAKDRGYAIGTNETYHVLDQVMPEDQLIAIPPNHEFPQFGDDIDIVFDLGGAIGADSAASILSAVRQSDIVFVPINNEYKSINGGFHTIRELQIHNLNIALIVTKITKRKNEIIGTWYQSADFKEVTSAIFGLMEREFPAFPLKTSAVFDNIFDRELSVAQICALGGVDQYHYAAVRDQFADIYKFIEEGAHAK